MTFLLRSTSGHGVRAHHRCIGTFEVKADDTYRFHLLEEAWEFFRNLNVAATLWDVTNIPELLESKELVSEP